MTFSSMTCRAAAAFFVVVGLAGCTAHPPGEREERQAARQAGKPFEKPFEARGRPNLPEDPTPGQIVDYALLNNADLEQRYWQWRSAIEQVPQDGTQTTTVNLAAGTTLTKGRTGLGSSTLTLANDPMTDIKWPGKLDAAASLALENARAAGLRFRRAQFDLRSKVLGAYYDYALDAELVRLEEANHQLLETTAMASEARSRASMAGQQDVLKARNEADISMNEIENMKAQFPALLATLNGLLGRPPDAPVPVPERLPETRPLGYDDGQLLAIIADRNPELAALAAEARGRKDAVQLARLQYFPDFNLSAGTDLAGITQDLLGQATIPLLRYEALNAAVAQAQANLRGTEAMRRQAANDLASQVILDVSTTRDADRQLQLLEHAILPRARQVVNVARTGYESGHATFLDLLDSQRTVISIERLVTNLRVLRARRLADLEAIAAFPLGSEE